MLVDKCLNLIESTLMILFILLIIIILFIIIATARFKIHPFLGLLAGALIFGLLAGMPLPDIVKSINEGFGGTIGHIGIIIIFGTIIGAFLEHSGGAFALAEKILRLTGKNQVPAVLSIVGYIVSVPVFADSGFVILSPLNRALTKKAGLSLASTAIALSLGLTISHNLVPPTPGPIAAAGILQADLGLVLMLGVPVSLVVLFISWLFVSLFAKRIYIDPNPELTKEQIAEKTEHAPTALFSVLPILAPIILIILKSITNLPSNPIQNDAVRQTVLFLGEPVIALLIGVLLALLLPKKITTDMLSGTGIVGKAILNAAIIIIITGAGGSFGKILQNSGIAERLGTLLIDAKLGLLLPFLIAATLKTAQGSSTVAAITTASLVTPLLEPLGLSSEIARALAVITIGSGSMMVSHANDSFFWVVTQMSDMDVKTGYKLHTLGTFIIGISSALIIWIMSWLVI